MLHDSGAKIHQVYDVETGIYRNVMEYTFPFVEQMLTALKEGDYGTAFHVLKTNRSSETELCLYFLIKYVLYSRHATELGGYDIHAADDVMAVGFNWCPPLAMIQSLGGLDEFEKLCRERFGGGTLECVDLRHLLQRVESSKYDYCKFIKEKK